MYSRLLVPLDGSPEAERAVPYARLIAKSAGATVELLQVVPSLDLLIRSYAPGYGGSSLLSYDQWRETQSKLSAEARSYLETTIRDLGEVPGQVKSHVVEGHAAEAIVAEAATGPDTIVVMATHGRSGIGRWALGSVAERVIHAGHQPTLIVRSSAQPAAAAINGIVLPLDGSDISSAAIPHAVGVAKALGASIHIVHAVQFPYYELAGFNAELVMRHQEDLDKRGAEYVRKMIDRLRAEGVQAPTGSSVSGDPGSAILDAVGSEGDRLVVMTTHARSGLQRTVLGSVTDRVVRNSNGPVLVVRPQ